MPDLENNRPSISAFLPCLNEEGNIERTVRELSDALQRLAGQFEIIVVDDGSSDNTAQVARRLSEQDPRIRLISHPSNLGYGRAVASGVAVARYELLFFSDGDGQFLFDDLNVFIPMINHCPIVVGYRKRRSEGWRRTLSSKVYNTLIRFLFALHMKDIDCSFKLFRRELFRDITIRSDRFFVDTEIMCKFNYLGYRFSELPVHHLPRQSGRSTVKLTHIFTTLRELWAQWREIKALCRR